MLKGGALIAAGLGFATKAAMDWESQFAGVKKTVDGTPQQIDQLEGSLRGMARTMAASHEEIAAVAEAAGQLGVATPAIAGFTRTMIMLGETTNLTSDEAATSLAQMMNVMQTAPDKVGNLASTLVALGNAGASTESEILGLTQRIASAGRQIGLSEDQVMGYASALANVGVEIEAGGTAMSMTFLKLEQISRRGGTALETVSKVAGTDFRKAFEDDAAGATQKFIEGLGKVQAAGGDVTGILRSLGITGVREADAIRRLASSGTNLASSLDLAKSSIQSQSAILNEYAARAATTESKVQVAWNNIKDSAIDAGSVMLPVVQQAADGLAQLSQAFGSMSPDQQRFAVGAAASVAGLMLLVGGGMKAIGMVRDLKDNLTGLGVNMGKVSDRARSFGASLSKALSIGAIAAITIRGLADASTDYSHATDRVADSIRNLAKADTGIDALNLQISDAMKSDSWVTKGDASINSIKTAFVALGNEARNGLTGFNRTMDATVGGVLHLKSSTGKAVDEFHKMDEALVGLTQGGHLDQAQLAFRRLTDDLGGESIEFAAQYFPKLRGQLEQTAAVLGVTNLSAHEYAQWMRGEVPQAVETATAHGGPLVANLSDQQKAMAGVAGAAAGAVQAMQQYSSMTAQLIGGEIGFKAALDAANKGLKEHGKGLDLNTEKGRANQTALLQIGSIATKQLQDMADVGAGPETIAASAERMRAGLAKAAEAMGKGKEEARAYAAALVAIPGEVAPTFSSHGGTLVKEEADLITAAVLAVPELAETKILAIGARPSKKEVDTFIGSLKGVPAEKKAILRTIAELGGVNAARDALNKLKGKDVKVGTKADLSGANAAKNAVAGVHDKTVTVTTRYKAMKFAAEGGLIEPLPNVGWQPATRLAAGGQVSGWSPHDKADNIPAMLTAREFVHPVAAVDYYGVNVMEALRRQLIPRQFFSAIGLADGGQVDPRQVADTRQLLIAAPAAAASATPEVTVIVQNPWTGEQVRAHTVDVVRGETQAEQRFQRSFGRQTSGR
ncbi:MAG: phage tail tape measure protein [Micropruina sp.]